jgi:signal transduction histidine kinase
VHADEGGTVRIETWVAEGQAGLRISNSGSKLSPEQVQHVFERFWRADVARQATGNHCGLGLALVKTIVAILGGSAAAESTAGGEFVTTVSIPGRPAAVEPARRLPQAPT